MVTIDKGYAKSYNGVMQDALKVLVYEFEKSTMPINYSFTDKVLVNIWSGKCKVDFKKIYMKIR